MKCPECGAEMNKHAEKVDYGAALEGAGGVDAEFGGVVEEAHACPDCGKGLVRRAGGAVEEP